MNFTFQEFVTRRFDKMVEKYHIPKKYHEDLKQEIALAMLEVDRRDLTNGQFGQVVERLAYKWYCKEVAHEDRFDLCESDVFGQMVEQKIQQDMKIKELQIQMDKFLEDFARTVPLHFENTVSKNRGRYTWMVNFIITADSDIDHVDIIKALAEHEGVSYESGRRVYTSMMRKLRHPRYSTKLRDFMEAFNEIHDLV